ncbi:MAG: hypothetical protein K6A80_01515 [Saccharofermentans sp.]|nr:hypothetical protein [Saccharofermentans sp.]
MSEDKKLTLKDLEAVGGGWQYDNLSPEDQRKCDQISEDLFNAGGTLYEEECRKRWNEFNDYLVRKYGVG